MMFLSGRKCKLTLTAWTQNSYDDDNHCCLYEFLEKDTMEVWVNGVVVETAVSM